MVDQQTQIKKQQDKGALVVSLLENEAFQEIIINDFIKDGAVEFTLRHSLNSDATIDQLKARQIFHEYLFGILTSSENSQL